LFFLSVLSRAFLFQHCFSPYLPLDHFSHPHIPSRQKIAELEAEYAKTQKNKATNYHLGLIKAKLAKLRRELIEPTGGGGGKGGDGFDVAKSGDTRVGLVGFPSVGKSTLLTKLTGTFSEAASYEFTTLTAIPGTLHYRGARIQIVDLPGIIEGAKDGKGKFIFPPSLLLSPSPLSPRRKNSGFASCSSNDFSSVFMHYNLFCAPGRPRPKSSAFAHPSLPLALPPSLPPLPHPMIGRGRQVISAARTCNIILVVLDVAKPATHKILIERELDGFGIRLNQEPPRIMFRKKDKGGINYQAFVPQTSLDAEAVTAICREYKIHNADVHLRCDATVDQIIDVVEGNRKVGNLGGGKEGGRERGREGRREGKREGRRDERIRSSAFILLLSSFYEKKDFILVTLILPPSLPFSLPPFHPPSLSPFLPSSLPPSLLLPPRTVHARRVRA